MDIRPAHTLTPSIGEPREYEIEFRARVVTDHPDDAIAQVTAQIAEADLLPNIRLVEPV